VHGEAKMLNLETLDTLAELEAKRINLPIPSRADIIFLFNLCMRIRLESRSFLKNTEQLRRLGLNAEIIAAHAQSHGDSYGILAAEVSDLAEEIRKVLSELSDQTSELAQLAIKTVHTNDTAVKYQQALNGMATCPAKEHIILRATTLADSIQLIFAGIEQSFLRLRSTLVEFKRLTIHIPVVTNLMKILASENEQAENPFTQMALAMDEFNVFLLEKIDLLNVSIHDSTRTINQIRESMQ
jgi:hypothetical protein